MPTILVQNRPSGLSKIPLVSPGSFADVTEEVSRKAFERNPTARAWNWSRERVLNIPVGARVYRDARGRDFVGFPPEVYFEYAEKYPEFGLMEVEKAKKRAYETGRTSQRASFAGQPSSLVEVSDELTRGKAEYVSGVLGARLAEAKKYRALFESERAESGFLGSQTPAAKSLGRGFVLDWGFKRSVTPKKIVGGSQINVRLPFGARLAAALRAQKKR